MDSWNSLFELWNEFVNEFKEYDYRVTIGAVVIIVVFVIEIILGCKGVFGNRKKKRIERARANGHVIEGHLIESWYESSDGGGAPYTYHGKYAYEINGKKKIKNVIFFYAYCSPNTIYFYYDKNPSKLYTKEENTLFDGIGGFLALIMPIAIGVIVTYILGYRG